MGRYRKFIFTLVIIFCLAAGAMMVMGLGNVPEKENETGQTEQEVKEEEKKPVLSKPVIKKATNLSGGIQITWKAVKDADGYQIEKDGKIIKKITNPEELHFLDKKAKKNGKKYKYVIYAYCEVDGKKIKSAPSKAFTQYYLKPAKINEAEKDKNGNIKVTWKENKKASGYEIQYAEKKNFRSAQNVYARKSASVSKKISGLQSGKKVYVRVRSYKKLKSGEQYSQWSAPVLLTAWNSKWKYAGNSKIHSGTAVLYYADSEIKKDKTVCVNAGHGTIGGESKKTLCHPNGTPKVTGGSTMQGAIWATSVSSGTTMSGGTPEAEANLKVAMLLKKKLLSLGYNVLMIRESSDVQLDNVARAILANHYADCHVSIHFDSTAYDKGAFVINVPNIASYRNMEPVASHWKEHNALAEQILRGMKSKGVKIYGNGLQGIDLTQTSYSTIPSVDVEVGDKRTSLAKKSLETIADGIAAGIESYLK